MSRKKSRKLALVTPAKPTEMVMLHPGQLVAPKRRKSSTKARKKRTRTRKRRSGRLSSQITPAGTGFLKCALAPVDFIPGATGFVGIPDEFSGNTIRKVHQYENALTLSAGSDNYIVMLPIPGYAYFYGHRANGTTGAIALTGVLYNDTTTLFPVADEDTYFNAFRYASNIIELVNTTNEMTWSGSILAWKSKIALSETVDTSVAAGFYATAPIIEGLSTLNGTEPQYLKAIKDGIYSPCFNSEENFDFTDIKVGMTFNELNTNASAIGTAGNLITFTATSNINCVGIGNLESVIIKLPTLAASQNLSVKTLACIEYQVPNTSPFYDFSLPSPPYDPLALELYKQYRKKVPCAVTSAQNGNFWSTFVDWVERAASLASYIPGPVGTIATGIQSVIGGVRGLF